MMYDSLGFHKRFISNSFTYNADSRMCKNAPSPTAGVERWASALKKNGPQSPENASISHYSLPTHPYEPPPHCSSRSCPLNGIIIIYFMKGRRLSFLSSPFIWFIYVWISSFHWSHIVTVWRWWWRLYYILSDIGLISVKPLFYPKLKWRCAYWSNASNIHRTDRLSRCDQIEIDPQSKALEAVDAQSHNFCNPQWYVTVQLFSS